MRKKDFEVYLKDVQNSSDPKQYVDICERIERIMEKDMDELVVSPEKVDETKKELEKRGSFKNTRAALHKYRDFAAYAKTTGWTVMPPVHTPNKVSGSVAYENSVRSYEVDARLCAFLEVEYDNIRAFARRKLGNIIQVFPQIPVFLSKELPVDVDLYRKSLLEHMCKLCEKCDRTSCCPPECPAFSVLREMKPDSIRGRYFDGAEPQIVIYFRYLPKPWEISNPEFIAAIAKTLAHEYLHFLHDYYVEMISGKTIDPFDDKILSEALADFFGVLYALEQRYTIVAEGRYDLWKSRKGTVWPYSHALEFFPKPYKPKLKDYSVTEMDEAVRKFRDVFRNTNDPKVALEILKS